MRLIDADALYERLKTDEELARDRVIDTPNSFPNGAVNPSAIRYMAQLSERTRFKEMVYDAATANAVEVIRCKYCKYSIDFYDEGDCYCRRPDRGLEWVGDWDFYCKAAERREDG